MSNQQIIERRFPLDHFLVRKIFGNDSFSPGPEGYCQIVYYDDQNPHVITANLVYLRDWENPPNGFINLVQEDLSFNECLILSTLYFDQPLALIKTLVNSKVELLENYLEYILLPTNGFLIFSFQFEMIAQLILDISIEEAIKLRKSYNKDRSVVRANELDDEKLKLFKGIVREYNITKVVYIPNYKGAKNLFRYATSLA
jgi:hypothetical protein